MAVIEPVGPLRPVDGTRGPRRAGRSSRRVRAGSDSVELSGLGRLLAKMEGTSPLRESKLAAVRREVRSGEYVTDERLREAMSNLVDEMEDLTPP